MSLQAFIVRAAEAPEPFWPCWPALSFLYHPLVPYCALVALVFAVSYAIYWKTKDPRFRLYLSDAYVHVGLGIIVVNFLVKNYLLAAKGIDILEQLPGW